MYMSDAKTAVIEEKRALFLCASLADEQERRQSFANNFTSRTIYRFADSIDGRCWSDAEADLHVSEQMKLLRERERLSGKLWINPAAIACALTHRDKLLTEAETQSIILCEDDIIIRSDFIKLWQDEKIRAKLAGLDSIVLLHYISRTPITTSSAAVAKFGIYRIFKLDENHVASGACYFAPSQVAIRLRQYQTPINTSADAWAQMKSEGVLPCVYVVHPSPCSIAGMASNIGYGSTWIGNAKWLILIRRLKRFVQRTRKQTYETLTFR